MTILRQKLTKKIMNMITNIVILCIQEEREEYYDYSEAETNHEDYDYEYKYYHPLYLGGKR